MTDQSWFSRDRFGLFIHWGLYALPARHEWVKQREEIPDEQYDPYFKFSIRIFTIPAVGRRCRGCGHEVLRGHHQTPRRVLPVGLSADRLQSYQHPGGTRSHRADDRRLSRRSDAGGVLPLAHRLAPFGLRHRRHALHAQSPGSGEAHKNRQQQRYIEYLHGQARELLSQFGTIDVMFYDFSYPASDQRWRGKAGRQRKGRSGGARS